MPYYGTVDQRPSHLIGGGRALPDALAAGPSKLHGYGIFARIDIPAGVLLGPMAIEHEGNLWRVGALGAFLNNSDDHPNVERVKRNGVQGVWVVRTIEPIEHGDELLITYAARIAQG